MLRLEAGQLDMTTTELRAGRLRAAQARGRRRPGEAARSRRRVRRRQPVVQPEARAAWDRTTRAPLAAARRSCGARSRWRSIASCSPTRCFSAPACRSTVRSRRRTGMVRGPAAGAARSGAAPGSELASIGLTDRNGDGLLEDADSRPARFALLTQKGNTSLERGAAVIRDELKKIGLTVDVVALDGNAVISSFLSGAVRRGVLPHHRHRHRSGDQPRFLAQLGQRARLEPRTEDAGHRVGARDRRA